MVSESIVNSFLYDRSNNYMDKLSTGNEELNNELEGGYPIGFLTEINGDSGSGKTLLAIMAIKECHNNGKIAVYIDTNNTLNKEIIETNDIDEDMLLIIRNNEADLLGPIISRIVKPYKDSIGLIILDDIANLTIKKENNSSMSLGVYKLRNKIVKSLLVRLSNICRNEDITCLILNQLRSNYVDNILQTNSTVSSFEKIIEMCCELRIKLSLTEDKEIEINIKKKERRLG